MMYVKLLSVFLAVASAQTDAPTAEPSAEPTAEPSAEPTAEPTDPCDYDTVCKTVNDACVGELDPAPEDVEDLTSAQQAAVFICMTGKVSAPGGDETCKDCMMTQAMPFCMGMSCPKTTTKCAADFYPAEGEVDFDKAVACAKTNHKEDGVDACDTCIETACDCKIDDGNAAASLSLLAPFMVLAAAFAL